jgi:hypothetical protein
MRTINGSAQRWIYILPAFACKIKFGERKNIILFGYTKSHATKMFAMPNAEDEPWR